MVNWHKIKAELEHINLGLSKIEVSTHLGYDWLDRTEIISNRPAYHLLKYHHPRRSDKAILLVYSWVNSPDILDFNNKASLVKMYQDLGFDVFLIKWKLSGLEPDIQNVLPYYADYLYQTIQTIQHYGYQHCHINGICQGGLFALVYASLYPNSISSLTLMMAPLDHSDRDALLYKLSQKLMVMINAQNMIPGFYLQSFFSMLKPSQYYLGRVVDAASRKQIKEYKIIEAWLNQTPDIPGELLKSYIQKFVEENAIMTNQFNLTNIACPVLNIYAKYDRLVPAESTKVIENMFEKNYFSCELEGGHLSALSDGRQQQILKEFIQNTLLKN